MPGTTHQLSRFGCRQGWESSRAPHCYTLGGMQIRRPLVIAALTLSVLAPVSACSSAPASAPTAPASAPVAPVKVDPAAWVQAARSPGTVVIDVRSPEEFTAGHLQGAINLNVESPDFAQLAATLDPATTYALYCHSGRRSAIAAATLAELGVVHVYDLQGGIAEAEAAGMPTA